MFGNPFDIPEDVLADMAASLSPEEQIAEASRLAHAFFSLTRQPLIVGPNQMKVFREAGVDCTHLLEIGRLPP
jgi:hypothetical protein